MASSGSMPLEIFAHWKKLLTVSSTKYQCAPPPVSTTFSCTTSALALGSHSLTATAAGQGTSAVFTYVVDTAAPTIASVDTSLGLQRVRICYNKAMSASGTKDFSNLASYALSGYNGGATLNAGAQAASAIYADSDNKCGTLS
jgi:hypothetical protein